MKIFLVTQGSYSDYHVCAAYSSEEKAKESLAYLGDDASIEEHIIDHTPELPKGLRWFEVEMLRDGTAVSVMGTNNEDNKGQHTEGDASFYRSVHTDKDRKYHKSITFYCITARGKEHAVKIANEKRIQIVAEGGWPDSPMTIFEWKRLGKNH